MSVDVARLRELLAKATPGRWTVTFSPGGGEIAPGWHLGSGSVETLADFGDDDSAKRDADFVAAAVNALPALLDENERLKEAVAEALTSLATGPAKDGYAYSVLDAVLAARPDGEAE